MNAAAPATRQHVAASVSHGRYYREIATLTDEVSLEAGRQIGEALAAPDLAPARPELTARTQGQRVAELLCLGTLWRLYSPAARSVLAAESKPQSAAEDVQALLGWMTDTDAFARVAARLQPWQRLLATHGSAERLLTSVILFAVWFEQRSETALGGFSERVERFVRSTRPVTARGKTYYLQRRRPVEYRVSVVSAELQARDSQDAFDAGRRRPLPSRR